MSKEYKYKLSKDLRSSSYNVLLLKWSLLSLQDRSQLERRWYFSYRVGPEGVGKGLNEQGLGKYRDCWGLRELALVKKHSSLMLRGLEKTWVFNHLKDQINKYFCEHQLYARHWNILCFPLMFTVASPEMCTDEICRVRLHPCVSLAILVQGAKD